jgi:hypothetical protein
MSSVALLCTRESRLRVVKNKGRLLAGFADMSSALSLTRLNQPLPGRLGISHVRQAGQCARKVPSCVNRLQIAAATDPTHSCCQREYLGPYRASTIKFDYSAYVEIILIQIRDGRLFFDGVARAIDGHVTVLFLTNESAFRRSRAEKSRNLL